jgi:hypothetical protein
MAFVIGIPTGTLRRCSVASSALCWASGCLRRFTERVMRATSEQHEFLRKLVSLLEDVRIPYMVTGSLSSSFHGQPRATHDVDIVIAPAESDLRAFIERAEAQYYVSRDAAWNAFRCQGMFNVIDARAGWKADLCIRRDRPFSVTEFSRRREAAILDVDLWVTSAEDVILSKLEWARESSSEQQFQDALGVLLVQRGSLDKEYLRRWAAELGVLDMLTDLLDRAGGGRQ